MTINVASQSALQAPFLGADGKVSWTWLKLLQTWQAQLSKGFDQNGNLISNLDPTISIVGRDGNIGSILAFITADGVILPAGMTSATSGMQGAVILPEGAGSNVLGSAALQSASAFDPAGSAAAAQGAAEGFATGAANAAQSNAESFASDANNLSSGTVARARLDGLSVTVNIAKLTVGGTDGSMTFVNGLLDSVVPAT